MKRPLTRRGFVQTVAAGSAALQLTGRGKAVAADTSKPAALGGTPVHRGGWPQWPEWQESWEPDIIKILRSGRWFRESTVGKVQEFEAGYAKLLGAKHCLATASGTTALITGLYAMGLDAGDEVIVSPYTFVATYNAILIHKALPVFADTDPTTLTIDPASIESRITDRTRLILPVHIYGMPCDMEAINAIAKRRGLGVVEDACQAWLAEYQGRKCGVLGDLGCFSFQNSKHIPSGEGGAISSDNEKLIDRCYAYHNCGRARGTLQGKGCFTRGSNFRMQHFQGAMLVQQFDKLVKQTEIRRQNADYLMAGLKQIGGIDPARLPNTSRPVWHVFPMRYDAGQFAGLSRAKFLHALKAEGVPCGTGYQQQYDEGIISEAIQSRGFQRLWGQQRLKDYYDSLQALKGNRQVCETTVTLSQNMLLADRGCMDQILEAIGRIKKHAEALARV